MADGDLTVTNSEPLPSTGPMPSGDLTITGSAPLPSTTAAPSHDYTDVLDWLGDVTGMNDVVQNLKSLPSEIANMPSTIRQNLRRQSVEEIQQHWQEMGEPVAAEPVSSLAAGASVAGPAMEGIQLLRYGQRAKEAGEVLGDLEAALKTAKVNPSSALDVLNRMKELQGAGNQLPDFAERFLARFGTRSPAGFVNTAQQEPLTFGEARDFYKSASHLSAQEFAEMSDEMKFQIGRFTNALGDEIKNTANAAGQGTRYTEAMKEFNAAKNMQEVMEVLRKWGVRAIGTGLAGGGLGTGWRIAQDLWRTTR